MKITIEVPELPCAKCAVTAPIQPVFLYVKGIVPPQFRDMLTTAVKERADVHAADDAGRTWETFSDDKPAGWTKGPAQSDLCPSCTALWLETGKAFLAPPEPVSLPEAEPEPESASAVSIVSAVSASEPVSPAAVPAAPKSPTLDEMIAAKNHENNLPVANSMMPPTFGRKLGG